MANKNNREIERRYLLKGIPDLPYEKTANIIQFYHTNGKRYRAHADCNIADADILHISGPTEEIWIPKGAVFTETFKKKLGKGINKEIEDNISRAEFKKFAPGFYKYISKRRHYWTDKKGLIWEVDRFTDPLHIAMAEVELEKMMKVKVPKEIADSVIMEVTGQNKKYGNFSLATEISKVRIY